MLIYRNVRLKRLKGVYWVGYTDDFTRYLPNGKPLEIEYASFESLEDAIKYALKVTKH